MPRGRAAYDSVATATVDHARPLSNPVTVERSLPRTELCVGDFAEEPPKSLTSGSPVSRDSPGGDARSPRAGGCIDDRRACVKYIYTSITYANPPKIILAYKFDELSSEYSSCYI
jgi:hypothetical protein